MEKMGLNAGESPLTFWYKNWNGETGLRRVRPLSVHFGSNEFHKTPQWLLVAVDLDKGAERTFAMADIIKFVTSEE